MRLLLVAALLLLAERTQGRRLRGAAQSRRAPGMPAECKLTPHQYKSCLSAGGCCTAFGCETGKSCIVHAAAGGRAGAAALGPGSDVVETGPSGLSDGAVTVHTVQTETRFGDVLPTFGATVGAIRPEHEVPKLKASNWMQLFSTSDSRNVQSAWTEQFRQVTHTPAPTPQPNFWGSAMAAQGSSDTSSLARTGALGQVGRLDMNTADFARSKNEFWKHEQARPAAAKVPSLSSLAQEVRDSDGGFDVEGNRDRAQDWSLRHRMRSRAATKKKAPRLSYSAFMRSQARKNHRKRKSSRKSVDASIQDMNTALFNGRDAGALAYLPSSVRGATSSRQTASNAGQHGGAADAFGLAAMLSEKGLEEVAKAGQGN